MLLLRAQPMAIPAALELARQTVRVMRQNLGWAVGYNLLGIPLAAGALYPAFHILLTPWLAAAAMALSSVCVLGNSLRLRGWQRSQNASWPCANRVPLRIATLSLAAFALEWRQEMNSRNTSHFRVWPLSLLESAEGMSALRRSGTLN